jgi:ferredoxin like protein
MSRDSIRAKLGRDAIKVDEVKHIKVKQELCRSCAERHCLYVCPAQVYSLDKEGSIALDLDACLECGTCRIACVSHALEWDYPRGGFGVQYKFG